MDLLFCLLGVSFKERSIPALMRDEFNNSAYFWLSGQQLIAIIARNDGRAKAFKLEELVLLVGFLVTGSTS